MATHHQAAVARRQAYLHTRAMARRKTAQQASAQKRQQQQASAQRQHSIDVGSTADAELKYGEQRNYLSRLLNDAPARYGSINKVYDDLSARVQDIARARQEGAGEAMARLSSGYAQSSEAVAGSDAGAQAQLAAKGMTADAAPQFAADRIGATGRNQEALGLAGQSSQAGVDNLYTMAGQAQLQKGENVRQSRIDDAQLRGTMLQTLMNMGAAKAQGRADREAAYAKSDAAAAAARATQAQTDQAERASIRSAQTKLDVSSIIALEKFGLGGLISAEKGSPQSVSPDVVAAILKLAGHAPKRPSTKAPGAKAAPKKPKPKAKAPAKKTAPAKPKPKAPPKHRTSAGRAPVMQKSGGVKAPA